MSIFFMAHRDSVLYMRGEEEREEIRQSKESFLSETTSEESQ